MITDTSLDAYKDSEDDRAVMKNTIYAMICEEDDLCSLDIATKGKFARTSVTARLKELEKDGLIYKAKKKKCEATGFTVWTYAPSYKVVLS